MERYLLNYNYYMNQNVIYIACCTADGSIMRCDLSENGTLSVINMLRADRPMYLAHNDKKLYALLRAPFKDNSCSGVLEIAIDEHDGFLPADRCISTGGIVSAHICLFDDGIYTANYLSGSITKLNDKIIKHEGFGPVKDRQSSPHPHQIIPTPDVKFLAVSDLGNDSIYTYDTNLAEISRTKFPDGCGPRHTAFSNDGKYAYTICELSSEIAISRYDNGIFSLVRMVPTLPPDFQGENNAAAIRIRDNELFVSQRGYDAISHFNINGESAMKIADTPCGGHWPRDFIIIGDFLIVANERSNNIAIFRRNNGIFSEKTFNMNCPAPLCIIT